MRVATFGASDDTLIDVSDLLAQYEPLGPGDLLPDLIIYMDKPRPEFERRIAGFGP